MRAQRSIRESKMFETFSSMIQGEPHAYLKIQGLSWWHPVGAEREVPANRKGGVGLNYIELKAAFCP